MFIVIVNDDSRNYLVDWGGESGAQNNLPEGDPAGLILGLFSYDNNIS